MCTKSIQGNIYFVTFIDDFSSHGVIYCLKTKDQFKQAFEQFLAWSEKQTDHKLKALRSDRGGEYMGQILQSRFASLGITHYKTMPGSPQQNGRAERWNRTLLERALSMLHNAYLSSGFWELAIHTAVHIYNRTPSCILGWKTPHTLWTHGHVPDVSYLRIFGCLTYVLIPSDKCTKLEPKSRPLTFVGYEPHSKGYRFWDSFLYTVILSRDAVFDEFSFPHAPTLPPSIQTVPTVTNMVTPTYFLPSFPISIPSALTLCP